MTIEAAISWLDKDPSNAVKINGWCVKTVETLLSDKSNYHMQLLPGPMWNSRSNSFKNEILEHPERCSLINLNGDHDTDYTDEMKCPYCGQEQADPWEYSSDDSLATCGFCDLEFGYSRNVSVSYSTQKIEVKK